MPGITRERVRNTIQERTAEKSGPEREVRVGESPGTREASLAEVESRFEVTGEAAGSAGRLVVDGGSGGNAAGFLGLLSPALPSSMPVVFGLERAVLGGAAAGKG